MLRIEKIYETGHALNDGHVLIFHFNKKKKKKEKEKKKWKK